MNTHFRPSDLPMTTRAAEGLDRRRWSVAEIEEMVRIGILQENERVELIEGELVAMSPKGNRHELLKATLNRFWNKRLRDEYAVIPETTFRLTVDSYLEPDFVFYRMADTVVNLNPSTALLVVEVSDSSLAYDLGRKAKLYAKCGITELWVINADTLRTTVHKQPTNNGYGDISIRESHDILAADFAPEIAVALATLKLA